MSLNAVDVTVIVALIAFSLAIAYLFISSWMGKKNISLKNNTIKKTQSHRILIPTSPDILTNSALQDSLLDLLARWDGRLRSQPVGSLQPDEAYRLAYGECIRDLTIIVGQTFRERMKDE